MAYQPDIRGLGTARFIIHQGAGSIFKREFGKTLSQRANEYSPYLKSTVCLLLQPEF
jgi:hypothetical protein